jgi:hypothetical protein
LAISEIKEGEQQTIGRAAWCIWRGGAAPRGYLLRVVRREQQAISITSIPYIRRRSCREKIWLWVES